MLARTHRRGTAIGRPSTRAPILRRMAALPSRARRERAAAHQDPVEMQMSFTRGRATTSPRTSRPAVASRGARLHPLPRATVLVLVLIAHSAAAQPAPATPPLAPDHWVHDALDRLASAGLLDGDWLAGARPASEHALAAAARVAAARADGSPLEPFAHAVAERLAEESSPSAGDAACSPAAAHRSFRA